jgi:hypothetical protein
VTKIPLSHLDRPGRREAARCHCKLSPEPTKADRDAHDQKDAAKHRADEIEIMTGTVWQATPHAGKQLEPFGDVGENHDR